MGHRIFVLGGAGNMGSELTRALLHFPDVKRVAIGELRRDAAELLAKELHDPRVEVVPVDVTRIEECAAKIRGYDLFVNATYFGFFDAAIRAACRAGVNYADLISEPSAEQTALVRQAGITAVSGLGCTPGLSNVLARHAANKFDQTLEIHIQWASYRTVAPSEGLRDTIIWELASECPTRQYYLNGRFVVVPPFQGSKVVRFADPIGEQTVYYMPHTETVSLAQNIPGVQYVSVRGTWRPELMSDFRVLNRYGLLDHAKVKVNGNTVDVADVTRNRLWQTHGGKTDQQLWGFFLNVEVIGRREGCLGRCIFNASHPVEWKEHSTARMTGIPAAVGAALLARHGRAMTGIVYPEQYYNPQEFLKELQRISDITIEESMEANQ
jgi:saccharopine dehydrogenase-like NADP-dependent oxidoreductase